MRVYIYIYIYIYSGRAKERGLRPMRVIIGGPPGSGKSTLCKAGYSMSE